MITFNEGLPGGGKSYDAIVTHILQAVRKGRKVFARLNGLRHDRIADFLQLPLADVERLLVHVPSEQVERLHELVEKDSLVVVDECHEFWPQSFKPLPTHVERFFAEHRHAGLDIVLLSQSFKRLHTALRVRVERKTVFQKLTALGMENKFLATFFHATGPDKFEKVGKATKQYDPAIFPLYDGVKPGTENTEVYKAGGMTVWRTVLPWFVVAVLCLCVGGYFYGRFFASKPKEAQATTAKPAPSLLPTPTTTAVPVAPSAQPVRPEKPKRPEMPPEAAYIWTLTDQAKPRLAGVMDREGGLFDGIVEWRADQQRVLDRLTVEQIRALGVMVERRGYGLRLTWGLGKDRQTIVVTAWPVDEPSRLSQQQLQDIRDGGPPMPQGASPSLAQGPGGGQGGAARYAPGVGSQAYTPPELTRAPK